MSKAPSRSAARRPTGPSQRQLRVGELLRRRLSEILSGGQLHDPDLDGVSITVGEVRVPADLAVATAFVLPLGGANREVVLAALRRAAPTVRRLVGREIDLRHVPEIRFQIDETFDRIEATRRLFADERVRRDLEPKEDGEA